MGAKSDGLLPSDPARSAALRISRSIEVGAVDVDGSAPDARTDAKTGESECPLASDLQCETWSTISAVVMVRPCSTSVSNSAPSPSRAAARADSCASRSVGGKLGSSSEVRAA